MNYIYKKKTNDYLMHYGAKGQKWGIRRWQNEDGSLTEEGRIHYGYGKRTTKFKNNLIKAKTTKEKKELIKTYKKESKEDWKSVRSFVKSQRSTGSKIVSTLLMGPFGEYNYNSMRAAGYDKGASIGAAYASKLLLGPLGNMAVSALISSDYKKRQ